jgi:two-component system response regulator (stage 0 sporulation protein F)
MPTILVIDDDLATRTVIELILKRKEFGVFVAPDGYAGLSLFETVRFDAVIVDMYMPGMDGLATMRALRRLDRSIPIIVMSGHAFAGSPDFLGMAVKLGASGALQKPFRADELLRAIERCLPGPAAAQDATDADGKRVA